MTPNVRAARVAFILTGQSLNLGLATQIRTAFLNVYGFRPVTYAAWEIGYGWAALTSTAFMDRVTPHADSALYTVATQVGGTTDYVAGATGAATYANEETCADGYRSRGVNAVIGATTNPSTSITGGDETNRVTGNGLVLADAGDAFEAVADLAADPRLDDPTDTTYYADGTHLTSAGAAAVAEVLVTAMTTIYPV